LEAVLIAAGFHDPVIGVEFVELGGNAGAGEPWHKGPIAENVGVMLLVMVTCVVFV
jgi:hypothetical protein